MIASIVGAANLWVMEGDLIKAVRCGWGVERWGDGFVS